MPDRWINEDGYSLNAVHGYTRFLVNFIREARPHYLMAAFDESLGSGFRHELYPDYKSNRALPDESLAFQLAACRQVTELIGMACYACERYEADDYIASAARLARRENFPVTVVTRDKDLVQVMAQECDEWWDYAGEKRLSKAEWELAQAMKVSQMADWLALTGDSIDAIPGVPGVGKLTATRLLAAYGDLAGIYANLDRLPDSGIRSALRIQKALIDNREQVLLARQLTGLYDKAIRARSTKAFGFAPSYKGVAEFLISLGCGERWAATVVKDLEALA